VLFAHLCVLVASIGGKDGGTGMLVTGLMHMTGSFSVRFPGITSLLPLLLLLGSFESVAATKNGFVLDDALIPAKQIRNGGPGRDGIPSLDNPTFVSARSASSLRPQDRVLGIEVNGVPRAYPIRILNYHEIVNDVVGGELIVITYCPLCGSGMAFNAEIDGKDLEFGVSGLLYNSDVLLYDRQTGSLWSQILKIAVTGTMKGTLLTAVPLAHTSWQDWHTRHPDSDVLSPETGYRRNYKIDPYPGYSSSGKLYFPVQEESRLYRRKAIVMGLEIDGEFKAYPFAELQKGSGRFTDEFNGTRFEVLYDNANETARILAENGNEMPTLMAFWFAWYAFHPDGDIYTAE